MGFVVYIVEPGYFLFDQIIRVQLSKKIRSVIEYLYLLQINFIRYIVVTAMLVPLIKNVRSSKQTQMWRAAKRGNQIITYNNITSCVLYNNIVHCVSQSQYIQAVSRPNSKSNRLSCLQNDLHRLPVFLSIIDSTLLDSSSLPLLLSLASYCMSAESKRHSQPSLCKTVSFTGPGMSIRYASRVVRLAALSTT